MVFNENVFVVIQQYSERNAEIAHSFASHLFLQRVVVVV